jgi:type IV pilus assembly protein PilM
LPFLGKPVSIEIGPDSVKVAQLTCRAGMSSFACPPGRRGAVGAVRFAEQELPPGARWEIGGDPAPIAQAIRQAMARAGIRARRAIIVLPRGQVTARVGAFPPARRDELRRVVEYDLADHIPFPVDQVVMDFQALGPSRDQAGLTDVLVVAAPRELIREHLRVAEHLGLRVSAVTIDALALDDLARMTGADPAGLALAIDVGPRATVINVALQGELLLTRSVAAGGNQLSRAIQDDFGVTAEEAQSLRDREGLLLLDKAPRPGALRAWADGLVGEIRRSALSFGPARVSKLVLTAQAAAAPGLADLLGAEFGIEPAVVTAAAAFPRADFWGTDPETADRCLLAMAAALRAVGSTRWALSLVPPEMAQARRAARARALAAAGIVCALLAMVGAYLLVSRQAGAERAQAARLRARLKSAETQRAQAQAILSERDRLAEQLNSLAIVPVRRYAALELLRAIAVYAPQDLALSSFILRPDQPLELLGTAADPAAVAGLQHNLSLSPLVRRADLLNLTRTARGPARGQAAEQLTFSIQVHLWTEKEAEPRAVSLRRERGRP